MKSSKKQLWIATLLACALVFLMLTAISCKKKAPTTTAPAAPTAEDITKKANDTAKEAEKTAAAAAEEAKATATEAVKAIEQTTCPVMDGNPINKDIFVEYKGKKVYLCCADCKAKFNANPEKYIAKLPQFNN